MIERGNPLLEPIERGKMEEKRPVPRRLMKILFTKKLFLRMDRCNPLSKRVKPKHVHLMTVRIPTLEQAHDRSGRPVVEINTENLPDGCHFDTESSNSRRKSP